MPRQVEWLNSNKHRHYPFLEDSPMTVSTGADLPDNVILDIVAIDYIEEPRRLLLQDFQVLPGVPNQIVFNFIWEGIGIAMPIVVPQTAAFPYTAMYITTGTRLAVTFGEDTVAWIMLHLTPTVYTMVTPVPVEPALTSFQPKHNVRTVQAVTGGSVALSGDIYLREGHNCQVTIQPDSDRVIIAAVGGAGEGIICDPPPTGFTQCQDVLLRINGLRGGSNGEFMLVGVNGVEVEPHGTSALVVIRGTVKAEDKACGGA